MKQAERDALVAYRLQQAQHALRQAEILANEQEWDGVVNRAYYAMFYGAFNQRQKSDYSELVPTSEDRAKEILGNAHNFLSELQSRLPAILGE